MPDLNKHPWFNFEFWIYCGKHSQRIEKYFTTNPDRNLYLVLDVKHYTVYSVIKNLLRFM